MKLSQWRRKEGRTQAWVAERTGVTQSFISLIERSVDPQVPNSDFMREAFVLTKGAVRPNDFYNVDAWEAELIERAGRAELDRQAA